MHFHSRSKVSKEHFQLSEPRQDLTCKWSARSLAESGRCGEAAAMSGLLPSTPRRPQQRRHHQMEAGAARARQTGRFGTARADPRFHQAKIRADMDLNDFVLQDDDSQEGGRSSPARWPAHDQPAPSGISTSDLRTMKELLDRSPGRCQGNDRHSGISADRFKRVLLFSLSETSSNWRRHRQRINIEYQTRNVES